jgi:prepilin-type N-terminal cleavage/methylation domain-containing protein
MTRRGFTLIELLVVISIVGVLVGLLAPALASARASAHRAACGANLRGIGQAVQMYRNANRDRLPVAVWFADAGTTALSPWDRLERYLDAVPPRRDWETGEAVTGQPWACPADDVWSVNYGFSYYYTPMQDFQVFGPRWYNEINRAFSQPEVVIFIDAGEFHPGVGHERKNALRADGSVHRYDGQVAIMR